VAYNEDHIFVAAFVEAYARCGYDGAKAYQSLRPGISTNVAAAAATRLFKHPAVKAVLAKSRKKLMKKFEISEERVLQEMACIAFLDIADLFNDDGSLKPISEIPEETRRALAGLEISELFDGVGEDREQVGRLKRLKVESKTKGLEMLGKYLEMFRDRLELSTDQDLANLILAARRRVQDDDVLDAEVFS